MAAGLWPYNVDVTPDGTLALMADNGPEGLAISPTGKLAVTLLLRGNNAATNAFFYDRNGSAVSMRGRTH